MTILWSQNTNKGRLEIAIRELSRIYEDPTVYKSEWNPMGVSLDKALNIGYKDGVDIARIMINAILNDWKEEF